jgi:benzil reductase ((S)-benzoin forming)
MQGVVRSVGVEDFPDLDRFKELHASGQLRPADDVARDILRFEAAGALKGDAMLDLRELLNAESAAR